MSLPVLSNEVFGIVNNQQVQLYTIKFPGKLEASVTNYGGILTALKIPDDKGLLDDIVLGYDTLEGYLDESPYFGALIGRFGNRIANGSFDLDGQTYKLAVNNGPNHLHGGLKGFDKVIWEVKETDVQSESVKIVLQYISPDGEEGYPGTLITTITYVFTENSFEIDYHATTDKSTVLNLTHHSYFNLSGDFNKTILDHEVSILADRFLPVDINQIPTGEFKEVKGTPFDFTSPKLVGKEIGENDSQIGYGNGFDHTFVFNSNRNQEEPIASVCHQDSGRYMEIITSEPGVQFYSGNFIENTIPGKNGVYYKKRSGLCLETQHFPDSPNKPEFPSVVLHPGEVFESKTIHRFSVK